MLVSEWTYQFWRQIRGATEADRLLPEIERTMSSISSVEDPFTQSTGRHLTLYRSYASTGDGTDATGHFFK